MSDSQQIDFFFNDPYSTDTANLWLPNIGDAYSKGGLIIENGVPTKLNSLTENAFGLTKAANKVKAIFDEQQPFQVRGYTGSFNTPVSLIGTNALMENLVYPSALADKLMTQKLMLQKGSDPAVVRKLLLKNAVFKSVTLTYLFRFDSYQEAADALEDFYRHADMVFCDHYPGPSRNKSKGKKKNVVPKGSKPELTVYINKDSNFKVTAYVKAGKFGNARAYLNSKSVENAVYAESSHYVRVEVKLGSEWLSRNQLQCPLAWKGQAEPKVYEKVLNQLRTMLRVDVKWRVNVPQQRHLAPLSQDALDVLDDHLLGKAQYNMGGFAYTPATVPKRVRNEIWKHLDIDIDIPWAIQSKQASNDVGAWLKWDEAFKAPSHLLNHCYVRSVVKQKIDELKAEVERLMHKHSVSSQGGKQYPTNRNNKWSKALDRISNHLKAINGDDDSTETSDVSDVMG